MSCILSSVPYDITNLFFFPIFLCALPHYSLHFHQVDGDQSPSTTAHIEVKTPTGTVHVEVKGSTGKTVCTDTEEEEELLDLVQARAKRTNV